MSMCIIREMNGPWRQKFACKMMLSGIWMSPRNRRYLVTSPPRSGHILGSSLLFKIDDGMSGKREKIIGLLFVGLVLMEMRRTPERASPCVWCGKSETRLERTWVWCSPLGHLACPSTSLQVMIFWVLQNLENGPSDSNVCTCGQELWVYYSPKAQSACFNERSQLVKMQGSGGKVLH